MADFKLVSDFEPSGDQPRAINELVDGIKNNLNHQTLLGVTGSGKTYAIAKVIEKIQKPMANMLQYYYQEKINGNYLCQEVLHMVFWF